MQSEHALCPARLLDASSMDEDARRFLELLRPALERAEQIGQQQQALLERNEKSAQAIADQIAKVKEAAETEQARLLEERADVTSFREAAVLQAREEANEIEAAARAEEATAHARIADLLQVHAQREAALAATMAAAVAERTELDLREKQKLKSHKGHSLEPPHWRSRGGDTLVTGEPADQ